jgi:hypothetical protein
LTTKHTSTTVLSASQSHNWLAESSFQICHLAHFKSSGPLLSFFSPFYSPFTSHQHFSLRSLDRSVPASIYPAYNMLYCCERIASPSEVTPPSPIFHMPARSQPAFVSGQGIEITPSVHRSWRFIVAYAPCGWTIYRCSTAHALPSRRTKSRDYSWYFQS